MDWEMSHQVVSMLILMLHPNLSASVIFLGHHQKQWLVPEHLPLIASCCFQLSTAKEYQNSACLLERMPKEQAKVSVGLTPYVQEHLKQ